MCAPVPCPCTTSPPYLSLQEISSVEQGVSAQRGSIEAQQRQLHERRRTLDAKHQAIEAEARRLASLEAELKARWVCFCGFLCVGVCGCVEMYTILT